METNHTPGPWKYAGAGSEEIYAVHDGVCIATVNHSPTMYDGVATANARLIAAAPDLLAALEHFVTVCDKAPPMHLISLIDESCAQARAAIARVRG